MAGWSDVLEANLRDVPLREDDDRRALRLARDVGHGEILVDHSLSRLERGLAGFLVAEGDANPAVFHSDRPANMSGH